MKINCIKIADEILENVKNEVQELKANNIVPKMVIIRSNDDLASLKYVNIKIKKAAELGIEAELITDIKSNEQMIQTINKLNNDDNVHGYLIQTPMYPTINQNQIFSLIDIKKDLDGLGMNAVFDNYLNTNNFYPIACTANGILKILLKVYKNKLDGKNVVIVNRSNIVGKPLFHLLLNHNCTVTVCHSKTKNIKKILLNADISIIGVGKKHHFNQTYFKRNSTVIDVGINVVDNKLYGDCNLENNNKNIKYTPVPNGVGKLTVAMIFYNLIHLIKGK